MENLSDANSLIALARGLKSYDENIRLGAVTGSANLEPAQRWQLLSPLISDRVLSVRSEAASALVPLWQTLTVEQRGKLQPALDDYFKVQQFNADRGFSHNNTGNAYSHQGKYQLAEQSYQQSLRIAPHFANAYVNYAQLLRIIEKNDQALAMLKQGISKNPDDSSLTYALGMVYVRTKEYQQASQYFKRSIELQPNNINFRYIYSLSLESHSPRQAMAVMREVYSLSHNPQYLYALCEMTIHHDKTKAQLCLKKLAKVAPENVVEKLTRQLSK
jgi:tetratricopeptide (TPR) repeat protein